MGLFSNEDALTLYINQNYKGNAQEWFLEEVQTPDQRYQANKIMNQKEYLNGAHPVLLRPNFKYKNAEFVSRKIIFNLLDTIVSFHSSFLAGNPMKITGNEERTKQYDVIYKQGDFDLVDYKLIRDVIAHGNAFEYIYTDEGMIKSHVIEPDTAYPVYNDNGQYLAFIEYYRVQDRAYYTVYYKDRIEKWTNLSADSPKPTLTLEGTFDNPTGLPIHYKSFNNVNPLRGRSIIESSQTLLDELEDTMSKFGDAINTWGLNPIPVVIGQRVDANIPTSAMGVTMNLEDGADFKFPIATMDTASIQLYIETIKKNILDVCNVPRIIFESASISNVSTDSLKFFYQNAVIYALETMRYIKGSFRQRFRIFDNILGINDGEMFDFEFDLNLPSSDKELLENLKLQQDMGAISIKTIIEQSPYTSDMAEEEQNRINNQGVTTTP